MATKMKETARKVFDYLRAHDGEMLTSADVVAGTGLTINVVTGSVNGMTRKDPAWAERIESETVGEDGKPVKTKYIVLTDVGRALNLDEEPEVTE